MRYYPLFLDISGRKCVVVGGGNVAERKVERLLACGALVEVVGRVLTPRLSRWKEEGKIIHRMAGYQGSCIEEAWLVIGATDDKAVNAQITDDARSLGIPVNIVDDPLLCDFILPSIVERGDLSIAISTGGKSPALAKKLRKDLEKIYGPEYSILLEILGSLREKITAGESASDENRERFEAVVYSEILDHIREGRWDDIRELILKLTGIEMEVAPR